jgi:hypothetical protein
MKIVPKGISSAPQPGSVPVTDSRARAVAAFNGQEPIQQVQQAPLTTEQVKAKIKMRTNATPNAEDFPMALQADPADIPDKVEPTTAATEDNQPLSPQFAALAKAKRGLQVREADLKAREEAIKTRSESMMTQEQVLESVKADPLEFLLSRGITYEQLTEAVKRNLSGAGPALTKVEVELRKEIQGLKKELDTTKQSVADDRTLAEKQIELRLQKDVETLVATDDAFEMIRDTGSSADVTQLIKAVQKEEGTVLTIREAAELVEADLLAEAEKIARIKKVQNRVLLEQQASQQNQALSAQDGRQAPTMRTLTNKDTVAPTISRRERAIAAALRKPA